MREIEGYIAVDRMGTPEIHSLSYGDTETKKRVGFQFALPAQKENSDHGWKKAKADGWKIQKVAILDVAALDNLRKELSDALTGGEGR